MKMEIRRTKYELSVNNCRETKRSPQHCGRDRRGQETRRLNGYILHVDLAPVKELVSLQRRCANNLNQVAVHANTFGVYPEEIAGLQRDYEKLWGRVSDVLTELSALVEK